MDNIETANLILKPADPGNSQEVPRDQREKLKSKKYDKSGVNLPELCTLYHLQPFTYLFLYFL